MKHMNVVDNNNKKLIMKLYIYQSISKFKI